MPLSTSIPRPLPAVPPTSFSRSYSSIISCIADSDDGKEYKLEYFNQCQHLPQHQHQPNSLLLQCQTCRTINLAIKALERHQSRIKARSTAYLQKARQALPQLYIEAMHEAARTGTTTPNRSRDYRKYSRQLEHWCSALRIDPANAFREWLAQRAREARPPLTSTPTPPFIQPRSHVVVDIGDNNDEAGVAAPNTDLHGRISSSGHQLRARSIRGGGIEYRGSKRKRIDDG